MQVWTNVWRARRPARWWQGAVVSAVLAAACWVPMGHARAGDATVQEARDAFRARDKARLASLRDALLAEQHPLAPWADFWAMQLRLSEASVAEVDDFLARWGDAYVADRLRNDWLLVLGQRKDWATFVRVQRAFRMNDDKEVSCLGILARQQLALPAEGVGDVREQARQAWLDQKDADTGCDLMAQTLLAAKVLTTADVWRKMRVSLEASQTKSLTQAARLLGEPTAQAVGRLMGQPQSFLTSDAALTPPQGSYISKPGTDVASVGQSGKRNKGQKPRRGKAKQVRVFVPPPPPVPLDHVGPLNALAFQRWAATDFEAAAQALNAPNAAQRWRLSREEQAWAWASIGRAAAWRLMPAIVYYERGLVLAEMNEPPAAWAQTWPADTLAWLARAAIRSATAGQREHWGVLDAAVDAMPPGLQNDPTWVYWRARSALAQAPAGAAGEARRQQARQMLSRIAQPVGFYGLLATEELTAAPVRAPIRPAAPSRDEQAQARATPGLDRALRLYELGMRSEGAKEWNYTLSFSKPGGLSDRELLAAAEIACEREVWDRCINTSERTRTEIDLYQRFPTPFKREINAAAREVNLEAAYMFGLIRQESRFQLSARSGVGASGLMQVMPATAAWTARKLGMLDYQGDQITDRDVNLKIGAGYLKLVLDDFDGSEAMAAAAYNAGPNRPRRWREGMRVDAAAWAENIPFNETRDYVKKVLANAVAYAHVLHGKPMSIKNRLGGMIGPRAATQGPGNKDLP